MTRLRSRIKLKLIKSLKRLDLSFNPLINYNKFKKNYKNNNYNKFNKYDSNQKKELLEYSFLFSIATFSLLVMSQPLALKLLLVSTYTLTLFLPITSQFFLPATPILAWLLLFYSSQFIPKSYRPHIWVSVLPTLESVLYGANISDILTRFTNPFLDVFAWLPYGVVHFAAPFLVAISLFVFAPHRKALRFWGTAFGYMNLLGVMIQIIFPCAPPWYELRNGLVPANYDMKGSPGGLARIDALFHGTGYTKTFTGAPVPFGAFPSLHAACATMEAMFLSHFFPQGRIFYWIYVFWLYWSTMYLTHHYLIDLVAGGSLAVICFYFFLPEEMRHLDFNSSPTSTPSTSNTSSPSQSVSSLSPTSNGGGRNLNNLPIDPESGVSAVKINNYSNGGGGAGEKDEELKNQIPPNDNPDEKGKSANA